MKTINQSIRHGVSLAYATLLTNFTNLIINPMVPTICEIDEDLDTIINNLQKYYINLYNIVGGDESQRKEFANLLQFDHKILENKFKTINAYSRELNHISVLLENKYYLASTDIKDIEGIDYHQFIHEGLDFINKSKSNEDIATKSKEFLRLLPMRMTRDSFNDYVRKSLKYIAANPSDKDDQLFISIFKQIFDGKLEVNYGNYFQDISIAIEDLRSKSQENLTSEDIEIIYEDIHLLKETIEKIIAIITTIHSSISSILILLILDQIDLDILFDEHVAFKDLYYTVKSLAENPEQEDSNILRETLPDRLDDVYNQIYDTYTESSQKLYDKLEKDMLSQNNKSSESLKVFSLIQYYLKLNVQDVFSFNMVSNNLEPLADSTIEYCINFLMKEFDNLKASERKYRMQHLIANLPFIMEMQEFANYFNTAIEGTSNQIQKAYILAKISSYMDSHGFFEKEQPQ